MASKTISSKSQKRQPSYVLILSLIILVVLIYLKLNFNFNNKSVEVNTANTGNITPAINDNIFRSPVTSNLGNQEFSFTLNIPNNWKIEKYEYETESGTTAPGTYSLTISNNEYTLSISQPSGYSPSECNMLNKYRQIQTDFGILRMEQDITNNTFKGCQQTGSKWYTGTKIGRINYTAPKNFEESKMQELDNIIKSIKITYL